MLADLCLSDLPIEALLAIKSAINDELLKRKKRAYITHRVQYLTEKTVFTESTNYQSYDETIEQLVLINSHTLMSLPKTALDSNFRDRMRYLPCLIAQNWDHLFPHANTTDPCFYVYTHLDPRKGPTELTALRVVMKGAPFYIGKGTQRRAWDLKRNQGHAKMIKQIRDAGFNDDTITQILSDNITELKALVLEAKLIYLFGSIYDDSVNGCLVNLVDHIKPQFINTMQRLPSRKPYESRYQKKEPQS